MRISFSNTAVLATLVIWCLPCFARSNSNENLNVESAGGVKLRKTQTKHFINRDMLKSQVKESHCGPDPKIVAAQEELKPWLNKLRESIENNQRFNAFQTFLLTSLQDGGHLSCVLTLDEHGQNISDFQSFLYGSDSGLIRQSQDSLQAAKEYRETVKEILSDLTPFELPPNGLPAANGVHIEFIRKGSAIQVASHLSPRKVVSTH